MIVVNLFGGPGCGKSTGAAYVFSRLKEAGVNVELVTEFAKDLTWDKSDALNDQLYVFANQFHRLYRCERSGVDVAVTDSPLLLSYLYRDKLNPFFAEPFADYIEYCHSWFDNLNFFVKRVKPYNPCGRREDEASAKAMDKKIRAVLKGFAVLHEVDGMSTGYEEIVQSVLRAPGVRRAEHGQV
jgi:hypothetical protein